MTTTDPLRVALALGSGGARGYAHIGVIDEVLARGWEIVGIAGTSMGAVIGGLQAAGALQGYRDWAEGLSRKDVIRLMEPTIGGAGMFRADKVMSRVREYTGNVLIEDLPIPFTAVATDLITEREVWFTTGDLVDAMRASIAIPSVFTPVTRDGMVLADGGLLNPVPVVALAQVRADAIIGVNLAGPSMHGVRAQAHDPAMRTMDVIDRSLMILQGSVRRYRIAAFPPDVLIDIPADACGRLDFHRSRELTALGRDRARTAFDSWDHPGA